MIGEERVLNSVNLSKMLLSVPLRAQPQVPHDILKCMDCCRVTSCAFKKSHLCSLPRICLFLSRPVLFHTPPVQ